MAEHAGAEPPTGPEPQTQGRPRKAREDYGRGPSYKLTVAYDGTHYAGWQVQPDEPTIQEMLEAALAPLAGRPLRIQGSGRTDSGVHARGQVASFDADLPLDERTIRRALNARLPRDVRVTEVRRFEQGFHALRDTVGKTYRYRIQDGPLGDVFERTYSWRIPQLLDEAAMAAAAEPLQGRHDFASFQATGAERKSTVRTVSELSVVRRREGPSGLIEIDVAADGFLYNMVRILVGTLVEVGKRKRLPEWAAEALAAADREAAGPTAPPTGLFLMEVRCRA